MSTIAVSAQGTLFKIESDSSVGTFTTIPEMHKITSPGVKFDLLDATSHDSTGGFKEYVPGLADGENATGEYWIVYANALHTQLRVDSYAKTLKNFKLIFISGGTGSTIAFGAYIVGINSVADAGQLQKSTVTCKVTGQPTWT